MRLKPKSNCSSLSVGWVAELVEAKPTAMQKNCDSISCEWLKPFPSIQAQSTSLWPFPSALADGLEHTENIPVSLVTEPAEV